MEFEFDEHALKSVVGEAMEESRKAMQQVVDRVYQQHQGAPVESVKTALERAWRTVGSLTDPELTDWATLISNGEQIVFKT